MQCCYNVFSYVENTHNRHLIWSVFCELKLWFMLSAIHCRVVCKIISYWTLLKRITQLHIINLENGSHCKDRSNKIWKRIVYSKYLTEMFSCFHTQLYIIGIITPMYNRLKVALKSCFLCICINPYFCLPPCLPAWLTDYLSDYLTTWLTDWLTWLTDLSAKSHIPGVKCWLYQPYFH